MHPVVPSAALAVALTAAALASPTPPTALAPAAEPDAPASASGSAPDVSSPAGSTAGSGAAAALPDPCHWQSSTRIVPCFSDPTASDETSSRIFQSIRAMVASMGKGDSLRVMLYYWGNSPRAIQIAREVVAAKTRGADIEVILDEHSDGRTPDKILTADGPGKVKVTICKDWHESSEAPGGNSRPANCLMKDDKDFYGPTNAMPMTHTKLWLFDIKGVTSVIAGSSNLSEGDYATAWNDMVRIHDTRLFGYLTSWWNRTKADDWNGWTTDGSREGSGDPRSGKDDLQERAYLYPRVKVDPIAEQLSRMTACSSDGDHDGDWDKRVYVAISQWNRNARTGIVDNLVRLEHRGCVVRVLAADGVSTAWLNDIRHRLGDPKGSRKHVRVVKGLHHKFVILDGKYANRWHEVVINGSDIWTEGSRVADNELNLRFGGQDRQTDSGAVKAYIDHYADLWNHHATAS